MAEVDRAGASPTRVVVRKLVLTVVGVTLLVASLTVLFLGMRSVMEIGGACATGGPYVPRQPCPEGTWLIPVSIFTGLAGTGLVVAGTFPGGPKLWSLAWPALFISLGWNFLEYGVDPPPPDEGLVWGWIVCAVVFFAMGGIPLLLLLGGARTVLWGEGSGAPRAGFPARSTRLPGSRTRGGSSSPSPAPAPAATAPAASTARPPSTTSTPSTWTPAAAAGSGPSAGSTGDLVADLERLAALHRSGALSDDEYTRAKAKRLAEEDA